MASRFLEVKIMTTADVDKLMEDLEFLSKDLQDLAEGQEDNYDDTLDLITTLIEQVNVIYHPD